MVTDIQARQALVLSRRKQFTEATAILQSCLEYWVRRNHPRWVPKTEYQLGVVRTEAEDQEGARRAFSLAEEGFQKVGDAAGAADCVRGIEGLGALNHRSISQGPTLPQPSPKG